MLTPTQGFVPWGRLSWVNRMVGRQPGFAWMVTRGPVSSSPVSLFCGSETSPLRTISFGAFLSAFWRKSRRSLPSPS